MNTEHTNKLENGKNTPCPLERRVGGRTGKEWLLLFRSWLFTSVCSIKKNWYIKTKYFNFFDYSFYIIETIIIIFVLFCLNILVHRL